jgi:hypothetical protein
MSELSRPGHDLRRIPPAYAKAYCGGYNVGGDLNAGVDGKSVDKAAQRLQP